MYGDALTTIARIKERLGITEDGFNTLLNSLILAVTARIETMCARRFIQAEYNDELHDGSDLYGSKRTILVTKNAPIHAIEKVEYKTGPNSNPTWAEFSVDDYDRDDEAGLLYFRYALPSGKRNIRITYTAGFSGYSIGVNNFWFFNVVPMGTVDGSNGVFTLPEEASQVIVYADGIRIASANITFVAGSDEFELAEGFAPYTTISADYLRENASEDSDLSLPLEVVEVCEVAVVRIFKKRASEGRATEGFEASQVTWERNTFSDENLATIRNYRRGDSI